jgi:predicted ABC-type ATPase
MREAVREVVLSYAGADRKRVAPLVHALEEDGLGTWCDQDIGDGQIFHRAIEQALTRAACVVVVWSRESIRSEWVINEASDAGGAIGSCPWCSIKWFRPSSSTIFRQPTASFPQHPSSTKACTWTFRLSAPPNRRRIVTAPLRPPIYNRARMALAAPARSPGIVVIGGPNGAGKSTAAPRLLRGALRVDEFVNADTLAQGLSAFRPEAAAVKAARVMLSRFEELVATGTSFACESTLASVTLAGHLMRWRALGYRVHVVYLWLPSAELALSRVKLRVEAGGHTVPAETVRRRFERGRANFFGRYAPMADRWRLYNAAPASGPELIATGQRPNRRRILRRGLWELASHSAR